MTKNLYDIFVNNWLRGGTVWLYSDPHFNDTDEFRKDYIGDEEQLKRINSKVGRKDTIIFLGDLGDLEFIKKIRGYKVLIMGNHEKGASNYKKVRYHDSKLFSEFPEGTTCDDIYKLGYREIDPSPVGWIFERYWDNGLFDEVYEGPLMVNDRLILSHEPINDLPSYMFNIHGHDHSNIHITNHSLNVCAEHINYTPINLLTLLKKGLLSSVKSIHRVTINEASDRKKQRNLKKIEKFFEGVD